MRRGRLIWPLGAALLVFPSLPGFCRQPTCNIYARSAPSRQDNSTCADARRGFRWISKNRPARAEALFRIALAKSTQANNPFLEAHSHRGLSDALFLEGKYPASKAEAEKALKIFIGLKDARAIALLHEDLGLIANQNGNRKLAAQLLEQAYGEFKALGDDHDRLLVLLDQIHEWVSDAKVTTQIARASSLARALHDDSALGQIESYRGDYAFADGNYALALASYQRSLKLLKEAGDSWQQSYALTSLGRLYRELNDPVRARKCYRTALRLQASYGDILGEMQSVNAIAVSYDEQKNWSEATGYYRKALVLARRTGSPRAIRFALGNLGGEYAESGRPARAIPILRKVVSEENNLFIAAYRYQSLSEAYFDLSQYEFALNAVNQAVRLRRQSSNEDGLVDSLTLRARILSRLGKSDRGLADTDEALHILEQIRTHLVPNDFLKRGFGDAEQQVYDVAIEIRFGQGDFRSAAEAAEAGRSRAFMDLLATREDATGQNASTGVKHARMVPALAAVSTDSTVYTAPLSAENMAGFARKLNSTLICYWATKDALYIIVVKPDGKFAGARVPVSRARLRRMIARIPGAPGSLGMAGTEAIPPGDDVWRQLYELLIEPISAYLPRRRGSLLTIIPHGPLFRVPFCALRDRKGHYLVERYATNYVPAAETLKFTEENEKSALATENRFLLVSYGRPPGVVNLTASARSAIEVPGTLAWADTEVREIHSLLKSRRGMLLESKQASVSRVIAAMRHSTLIHVADHAEFNEAHPLASFLQLAPDPNAASATVRSGRLTAAEILNLHIPADLVVLSACHTSAGKISGDGVLGMTRAFFAAGAASIVATQWAIADKPSDLLMTRFYRYLLAGMSKAEALRSAQLDQIEDLRKGRVGIETALGRLIIPETPRYWAGFVLDGNP